MPKLSNYQLKKRENLKKKAIKLYKQGLTTREIAPLVRKSHTWIAQAIKELSTA
jgi:transposase-like protein